MNGGGGRIRTFEVDDGRFTVCSLWPLGNPTRGKFIVLLTFYSVKDYSELKLLTLRAVAFGNVLSLSLESNLEVDDGRFAVSSLMNAREPHHGAMLFTGLLPVGSGAHHIK